MRDIEGSIGVRGSWSIERLEQASGVDQAPLLEGLLGEAQLGGIAPEATAWPFTQARRMDGEGGEVGDELDHGGIRSGGGGVDQSEGAQGRRRCDARGVPGLKPSLGVRKQVGAVQQEQQARCGLRCSCRMVDIEAKPAHVARAGALEGLAVRKLLPLVDHVIDGLRREGQTERGAPKCNQRWNKSGAIAQGGFIAAQDLRFERVAFLFQADRAKQFATALMFGFAESRNNGIVVEARPVIFQAIRHPLKRGQRISIVGGELSLRRSNRSSVGFEGQRRVMFKHGNRTRR